MDPREELAALRRLAELEARAAGGQTPAVAPAPSIQPTATDRAVMALTPQVLIDAAPAGSRMGLLRDQQRVDQQTPLSSAQIPGAGPYVAPPVAEVPIGRRVFEGARQNIGQMTRMLQPSAELLASTGGAVSGAAAGAPFGPVGSAVGGLVGGITGFTAARGTAEALQGQRPALMPAVEEAVTGELIGRSIGPVVRAGARGMDLLRSVPQRKAVEIARQAAGPDISDIRVGLATAAPDVTPRQATAQLPRQAWQSLLAFEPTDFAADVARRQKALSEQQLGALAGGTSQTAAREAAEAEKRGLTALTTPMRETELAAANEAQRVMNALVPRREQKQVSMVSALQQGGKTGTEAAQRAEAAALQLQRVEPGRIPAVSATQEARTQAAASRQFQETANIFGDIAQQRRGERDFIDRQIGSLEAYGLRPLDIGPIVRTIDTTLNTPGIRASTDVTRVLGLLKDDLASLAQRNGGVIDAHDLYTLRKEGVAQRVRDVVKQDDPKAAAKVTAAVVDKFRPLIDDAIEKAGGTGWRQYLDVYSKGMDVIARKQMAAQALDMFNTNPQDYVRLVRGNNLDAVEAIFGPGRYSIFKEMANEMPTLDKVAKRVELDKLAAEKAGGGKEELARILEANRAKLRLPNWFSPTITAANMRLADVEKRVNKKTIDLLRQAAESNQSMLDLLNGLPAQERQKLLRLVSDQSTWAAPTRAAIAPAMGEVSRQMTNALAPESSNALAQ